MDWKENRFLVEFVVAAESKFLSYFTKILGLWDKQICIENFCINYKKAILSPYIPQNSKNPYILENVWAIWEKKIRKNKF